MSTQSSMARGEADSDLRRLREDWEAVEVAETRLLRAMTVQESLQHLAALQRAFEPQLRQTEPLYRADRVAYLEELQRRLARLGKWMEQHGEPL